MILLGGLSTYKAVGISTATFMPASVRHPPTLLLLIA